MRITYSLKGNAAKRVFDRDTEMVRIGSDAANDIVLSNPYVSNKHAILSRNNAYWELTNVGRKRNPNR